MSALNCQLTLTMSNGKISVICQPLLPTLPFSATTPPAHRPTPSSSFPLTHTLKAGQRQGGTLFWHQCRHKRKQDDIKKKSEINSIQTVFTSGLALGSSASHITESGTEWHGPLKLKWLRTSAECNRLIALIARTMM